MIIGVGTDILEIERIAGVYQRQAERFVRRILTPEEQKECKSRASAINYLSKQFAAKEAISKALGVGIGKLGFQDIEILRDKNGKPYVNLSQSACENFKFSAIHLSLSDTKKQVLAFCVIEA